MKLFVALLQDEGVDILLSARVKEVSGKSGDAVSIIVDQNGTEKDLEGQSRIWWRQAARQTPRGLDWT